MISIKFSNQLILFLKKKCASYFVKNSQLENNQLSGNHCELDISIYEWKVTSNYANSPLCKFTTLLSSNHHCFLLYMWLMFSDIMALDETAEITCTIFWKIKFHSSPKIYLISTRYGGIKCKESFLHIFGTL